MSTVRALVDRIMAEAEALMRERFARMLAD